MFFQRKFGPSTNVGLPTVPCNFNSMGSDALFCLRNHLHPQHPPQHTVKVMVFKGGNFRGWLVYDTETNMMWIYYLIKREIIERWLPSPSWHVEKKDNTVTWKPEIGSSPDSRSARAWPWASSCQLCEKNLLFRPLTKTSSGIIRDRICLE